MTFLNKGSDLKNYSLVVTSLLVFLGVLFLFEGSAKAQECTVNKVDEFRQELFKLDPDPDKLEETAICVEAVQYSIKALETSPETSSRFNAAYAISISGTDNIQKILDRLILIWENSEQDAEVRRYLIISIGNSQQLDPKVVSVLLDALLSDSNGFNRGMSAFHLGNLQADPDKVLPILQQVLTLQQPDKQDYVFEQTALAIAAYGIKSSSYLDELQQLVQSQSYTPIVRLAIAQAIATICEAKYENLPEIVGNIRTLWSEARQLRQLSQEFEEVLQVLNAPELADSYKQVKRYKELVDSDQRDLVLSLGGRGFTGVYRIGALHSLFWLTLIFAYRRSPMVQTVFFWTPRIRRILGFPYVTAMLKWLPPLRRVLFIPFQYSLRSDANLDLFNLETYFPDVAVKAEGWAESKPIDEVISQLEGQIVLQGEAGSGKSMFLRYLLKRSSRIAVYLPAQKCEQGVIAAIQAKLYGQAQDADFLRDLIYAGAINIYIDGLNEVTPDTRAHIRAFMEKNFKGNIILATQPLEWKPPGKVYTLQPLGLEQISTFLYQHCPENPAQKSIYEQTCSSYLQTVQADLASDLIPEDEKATLRQSLSNPMDLTVVAQLLTSQRQPNLLRLREQQYSTMAEDYQRIYLGRLFPLATFSEMAYQLRLQSQTQILETDFTEELLCLKRHKMVVSRQKIGDKGDFVNQWFFRHEKVADYFVAQAFLQAAERQERQTKHFSDSRFRGVYLLLSTLLPDAQKMVLREQLIQYAVKNNDHVLSDAFIQRVSSPTIKIR